MARTVFWGGRRRSGFGRRLVLEPGLSLTGWAGSITPRPSLSLKFEQIPRAPRHQDKAPRQGTKAPRHQGTKAPSAENYRL